MIDEKNIPEELPEDLKGDIVPEINPEQLFDEEQYSTVIVGNDAVGKKDLDNADYVTILVSPKTTREEKDEALIKLKENNAQAFMLKAITKTKKPELKALVVAACWETGLDFSKDFLFFIDLICSNDFHVSLEAFTVIEEMESIIEKPQLKQALDLLNKVETPNMSVNDAIDWIKQRLEA